MTVCECAPDPKVLAAAIAEAAKDWAEAWAQCTCDPEARRYDDDCRVADTADRLRALVRQSALTY